MSEQKIRLIVQKIKKAMKDGHISRKDLAEKLGTKPPMITKWLSGTNNFTADTLFKIQEQLNIRLIDVDLPEQKQMQYVYFISFSYTTLSNQLRNNRIQLSMDWEVDNMVKVNEMENKIREFMFSSKELFGISYPAACEGDPFSVSVLNFQLLRTEEI